MGMWGPRVLRKRLERWTRVRSFWGSVDVMKTMFQAITLFTDWLGYKGCRRNIALELYEIAKCRSQVGVLDVLKQRNGKTEEDITDSPGRHGSFTYIGDRRNNAIGSGMGFGLWLNTTIYRLPQCRVGLPHKPLQTDEFASAWSWYWYGLWLPTAYRLCRVTVP